MAEPAELVTEGVHIDSKNSPAEVSTTSHQAEQGCKSCCYNSQMQTASPDSSTGEKRKDEPKEEQAQSPAGETLPQPERQPSPEPNCSICLGKMENKSFTNSCFHQFCFTCLLEWSKVKPECPLCKQPFKSIVHNVRSMEDYDQYHLRFEDFNSWENPDGRRFRYRSTLTSERRRELTLSRFLSSHRLVPGTQQRSSPSSFPVLSTSDHRRWIYEMDLWVKRPIRSTRFRETSPQFYTQNAACTHRLVPWLNRELNALQYGHQVAFLMELILSLILRFNIISPEFEELIRPYFLRNTNHFIHEFYNFARSPHDMVDYDRRSSYTDNPDIHPPPIDLGNWSDSDVVILSPDRSSRPRWSQRPLPTSFPRPSTEAAGNLTPVINRAREFLQNIRLIDSRLSRRRETSEFHPLPHRIPLPPSPQPGPSGLQHTDLFVNEIDTSSDEDDRPITIQSSTLNQFRKVSNMKVEVVIPDDAEDDDDCIVVGYEKPLLERSPVDVIVLEDSSDDEQVARNVSPTNQVQYLAQPSTSLDQPSTSSDQPSTSSHQPSTSSQVECTSQEPLQSNQGCCSPLGSKPQDSSASCSSLQPRQRHPSTSPHRSKQSHSSASSSPHGVKLRLSSTSSSPHPVQPAHTSEGSSTSKAVSKPSKRSRSSSSRSKPRSKHKHHNKHHHSRSKKSPSRSRSSSSQQDTSDEDYSPNPSRRKRSKKKHSHKRKKCKSQGKKLSTSTKEKEK